MIRLICQIDKVRKFIMIWLTHEDQNNAEIKKEIENITAAYSQKYKVAVFYSGEEDLFECTEKLLLKNLDIER